MLVSAVKTAYLLCGLVPMLPTPGYKSHHLPTGHGPIFTNAYPRTQHHHAVCPPSIFKSEPVIKLLASLMRKTAAPRYSFGWLNFPSIFCVGQSRRRSGYCSNKASTMAVTMYPGEMVLTRMPWPPHSAARLRASWMTPALEAL